MQPEHPLAMRQQHLIQQIFSFDMPENESEDYQKGLRVYQNNLLLTAARALTISHPVLEQLIGYDAMVALSRMLLQHSPPDSGDWGDWGETLSVVLQESALVSEYPFLTDVARLEWLIYQASRCETQSTEIDSLALLAEAHPDAIRIVLPESVNLFRSHWPVKAIWQSHQSENGLLKLNKMALERALRSPRTDNPWLMISQKDYKPVIRPITEQEYLWIQGVMQGDSLGRLLDKYPAFDFATWLPVALHNGSILRLTTI